MLIVLLLIAMMPVESSSLQNKCIDGIYLQNLIYASESDWSFTLNGKTYVRSAKTKIPFKIMRVQAMITRLFVLGVSKKGVQFSADAQPFFLRPGESFDVLRKKILWGRCMYPYKKPA